MALQLPLTHLTHCLCPAQIVLKFTATGNQLKITAPPTNVIAIPGVYWLFAVSNQGRPSQGLRIGFGGVVPPAPIGPSVAKAVLPDGVYTITSTGRANCPNQWLGAPTCANVATTGKGKLRQKELGHAVSTFYLVQTVPFKTGRNVQTNPRCSLITAARNDLRIRMACHGKTVRLVLL